MSVYEKLAALNITLPPGTTPAGSYVPCVRSGNLAFLSGHIAKLDGKPRVGRLGADMTTEQGQQAARQVAIDILGTLHESIGDLNRCRILRLTVLVNSTPEFIEHPQVGNGASELFHQVLGEKGLHARSAFGAVQLPRGTCLEIEATVEVAGTD